MTDKVGLNAAAEERKAKLRQQEVRMCWRLAPPHTFAVGKRVLSVIPQAPLLCTYRECCQHIVLIVPGCSEHNGQHSTTWRQAHLLTPHTDPAAVANA